MKVSVNYDLCTGVGACEVVCPDVFQMRADGLVDVVDPQPHVTLWDAVYRAQEACPEDAIVIEED